MKDFPKFVNWYYKNNNIRLSLLIILFLKVFHYDVYFVSSDNKPVSPYSGYNGQVRSSVYQPTELALITKGMTNVSTSIYCSCFAYANPHGDRITVIIQLSDSSNGNLLKFSLKAFYICYM